jgi:hypothetical protein
LECDFQLDGAQPIVSYLKDDPAPTPSWNALTNYAFEPPFVYNWPDRLYLSQQQAVAVARRTRMLPITPPKY